MLKLSTDEKLFLDRIKVFAKKEKKEVREVFLALLMASSLQMQDQDNTGDNEIVIPYICKLRFSHYEKTDKDGTKVYLQLEAIPSETLREEMDAIVHGEDTPVEKLTKKKILEIFKNTLGLDEEMPEDFI